MFSPTHIYFFDYTRKYGQRKHVFWHVLRIAKPGGKMCWRNEALEYWNLLKVNLSHRVRYLGTQCIVYAKKSLSKRSYKKNRKFDILADKMKVQSKKCHHYIITGLFKNISSKFWLFDSCRITILSKKGFKT